MSKNNFIKIVGAFLIVLVLLIVIFINVSTIVAVILGVLLGIGIGMILSGEETQILGKQIFRK